MNIVLDSNGLLMAISDRSRYHLIWQAFLHGDYKLCVTNEIMEEYVEVISRNVSERAAEAVIYLILTLPNVRYLDPHFRFKLIETDPDDNKFVDCAIAAGAKYIVTEDRHFGILKEIPFPKVEAISIDQLLKIIGKKKNIKV